MILLAIALSLLAAAQPFKDVDKEELALTNVVFAPGAPAVVLDWTVDRDDDHSRETESVRIKVLTDEGKKYANIELPYQKRESGIRDLSARTIQPDGSVVPFDGRTFDKLVVRVRRENMMAKTFTLPDVRVGSIIEYRYTREWGRDSFHFAQWELEREIPILHERISFRPWSGPLAVFYTGLSIPGNKTPEFVDKKYELELRNPPPFEKEPFAPPEVRTKAILIFFYRMSNTTTTDYWTNAAGFESHVFEDFMKETPEIVNEARQITGGAANDEEKLRRIYARVQKIRNLSYEREKSDEEVKRERLKENKSAGDVLRNGYASGNQLDQLFIALARAAGFVVEPVLVCDRDEPFSQEIPEIRQLSDLTARVMIGGQPRYFDPGCPFIPFGQLQSDHAHDDEHDSAQK